MANTLKIKKETIIKIKPMMNRIVTTADVYTQKECYSPSGLLLSDQVGKIKQIQKVIAVGPVVRNIEVGDYVFLDFTPFEQKKYSKDTLKHDMKDEFYNSVIEYKIPTVMLDNTPHLLLSDNCVCYIIDQVREEEVEITTSDIILPKTIIS